MLQKFKGPSVLLLAYYEKSFYFPFLFQKLKYGITMGKKMEKETKSQEFVFFWPSENSPRSEYFTTYCPGNAYKYEKVRERERVKDGNYLFIYLFILSLGPLKAHRSMA